MANSLLPAVILLLAALALNLNLAASSRVLGTCRANGRLRLQRKTDGHCRSKSISNCCEARNTYARYRCSPPVERSTPAIMTFNSFTRHGRVGGPSVTKSKHYTLPILRHARTGMVTRFANTSTKGGGSVTQDVRASGITSNVAKDGNNTHLQRGMSKCDNKYHDDTQLVVALSTGWYNGGRRCLRNIRINGHGKSVMAKVVDECDSVNGCDSRHGFRVPCANNIVDASPAVWKALGIPKGKIGNYQITWSDV